MKKYFVTVKEVWNQVVEIEANSKEEALKFVSDGQGEYLDGLLEYNYTLDPDVWNVED